MKIKVVLLFALFVAISASCGNSEKMSANRNVLLNIAAPDASSQPAEKVKIQDDRKIIKEGTISFETGDLEKTRESIFRSAGELGGYISKESSYYYSDRSEQTIIVRVPSDKFEKLLTGVTETAVKIDSKNIDAQDVTEDYIDTEARLNTKKELEERYKQLLQKASTVADIMSIEREMGKLREEIESVEGRFRYLKDRVALSTLTITFYEKLSKPFGFGSKLGNALKYGWRNFLLFMTGLVSLWPFLILAGAGIFAGIRISKRKRMRKQG